MALDPTPEEYGRLRELFARVMDLTPEARDAVLADASPATRDAVLALLAEESDPHTLVELAEGGSVARALAADAAHVTSDAAERHPEQIGPYRVLRVLGVGGMGCVYEAEQSQPRRRVAVKLMRDALPSRSMADRFRREIEVLGRLEHPGIAHVHDAGVTEFDGHERPWFAMEFVDGPPIDTFVRTADLPPPAIIELVARVADAIQHAHQKGVIHRDLKPANILVRPPSDDRSSQGDSDGGTATIAHAVGHPKILDFGVSRLVDEEHASATMATQAGQLIGTLSAMAPEQVGGDPTLVDTRTDVHALGALLYELLVGRPPFQVAGQPIHAAIRTIAETPATRLGQLDPRFRGDIETIVAKSLEKEPERRYAGAAAFADDLRRSLRDEPIEARPASAGYQLRKFARRNRGLVAAIASATAILIGALIVVSVLLGHVAAERDEAALAKVRQQQIADFQSEIFTGIDVGPMATRITEGVRSELQAWGDFNAAGLDPAAFETRLDATNIARAAFEANVIERATARLDAGAAPDPVAEATLRDMTARMYRSLHRYESELAQAERALHLWRRVDGVEPARLVAAIRACAFAAEWAGRLDDARAYATDALDTALAELGPDHVESLDARVKLAQLLTEEEPERAEAMLLAIRDMVATRTDVERWMPQVEGSLAGVYAATGRLEQAAEIRSRALELAADDEGRLHDNASLILASSLAADMWNLGRPEEAIALHRRALDGWLRRYGDEHEGTIRARLSLASMLAELEVFEEATAIIDQARVSSLRVLAPGHASRVGAVAVHAACLRMQGRYEEAMEVLRPEIALLEPDVPEAILFQLHRCLPHVEPDGMGAASAPDDPPEAAPAARGDR